MVEKAANFNPDKSYLVVNNKQVWQGGSLHPITVLAENGLPLVKNVTLNPGEYFAPFEYGADNAAQAILTNLPNFATVNNPDLYGPMFNERTQAIQDVVDQSLYDTIYNTVTNGLDDGLTYSQIGDLIQTAFGIDAQNPDYAGYRADRIAKTESQWAINEGMRMQYQAAGINYINILLSDAPCDICQGLAQGNPYDVSEAGIIPGHPNCECNWVADWSQFNG